VDTDKLCTQVGLHLSTDKNVVVLHCGKAHVQSQWERVKFDPHDIKIT